MSEIDPNDVVCLRALRVIGLALIILGQTFLTAYTTRTARELLDNIGCHCVERNEIRVRLDLSYYLIYYLIFLIILL